MEEGCWFAIAGTFASRDRIGRKGVFRMIESKKENKLTPEEIEESFGSVDIFDALLEGLREAYQDDTPAQSEHK